MSSAQHQSMIYLSDLVSLIILWDKVDCITMDWYVATFFHLKLGLCHLKYTIFLCDVVICSYFSGSCGACHVTKCWYYHLPCLCWISIFNRAFSEFLTGFFPLREIYFRLFRFLDLTCQVNLFLSVLVFALHPHSCIVVWVYTEGRAWAIFLISSGHLCYKAAVWGWFSASLYASSQKWMWDV